MNVDYRKPLLRCVEIDVQMAFCQSPPTGITLPGLNEDTLEWDD